MTNKGESSSSADSTSLEEFNRLVAVQLEKYRADDQARRFRDLPPEALLWMALVPGWTIPLAEACHFPASEGGVVELLERMRAAGLVEVSRPLISNEPITSVTIYTMNGFARAEVLNEYLNRPQVLRSTLVEVGQRISKVALADPAILPPLRRWAKLAAEAEYSSSLVGVFDEQIEAAFQARDSVALSNWIEAARPLASLLARDLDTTISPALQRASRRLELLHRREHDARQLQFFLGREEQVAAFEALMRGDDSLWALHYIGAGGMGKTMLMRHISTDLASQWGAAVARIDFDYFHTDYPSRAPGLLLWSFSQELRAYDQASRASKNFDRVDGLLRILHERLRSDSRGQKGQRVTDDPLFREALALYIDALKALSRRVILIVDTCEELAKTRPDGTSPEDVEETFRILRALHDGPESLDDEAAPSSTGLPDLRVIFAGRQPLASAGYKWRCSSSQLKVRPYLRLHEIRGFSHDEAYTYLHEIIKVPEELIPAVIHRSSPDGGSSVTIEWEDAGDRTGDKPRCNPYELRLYADWAREEPAPSPETIKNAHDDKYVELRIIRRLGYEPLVEVLPAVALLGHFDREALRAMSDSDEKVFNSLFEKLREQEWISQRLVSVNDGAEMLLILDVEPWIQERLLDYFERGGNGLNQVRKRAADYLESVTLQRAMSTLDWFIFDATLRVMEAEPERGATWWKKVEARIVSERDWNWIRQLTGILTGADSAVGSHDHWTREGRHKENPLRTLVLATYASALLHTHAVGDLAIVWHEVAQKAKSLTVPDMAKELQVRALAGSIVAAGYTETAITTDEIRDLWQELRRAEASRLDVQVAAAFVAATEAVLEYIEALVIADSSTTRSLLGASLINEPPGTEKWVLGPVHLAQLVEKVYSSGQMTFQTAQSMVAFACVLAARALQLSGDYLLAQNWFQKALDRSSENLLGAQVVWLDWLPPDDLAARIRLEFVRATYPVSLSPREALAAVDTWQGRTTNVDSERLHSALLRLRLAEGPVGMEALLPLGWADPKNGTPIFRETDLVPGPPACRAHKVTPPLFTTVAEIVASKGLVEQALPQLRYVSSQAGRFDLDTVRHAERSLLRIIGRMRLGDEHEGGGASLVESSHLDDQVLQWTVEGLEGPKAHYGIPVPPVQVTDGLSRAAWLHAIWQTRYTLDMDGAATALKWAREHLVPPLETLPQQNELPHFLHVSLQFDRQEILLLAETESTAKSWGDVSQPPIDPGAWWHANPDHPVEALTLWLRAQALELLSKPVEQRALDGLVSRLGLRRAAEIAQNEGELLAMKLPARAVVILDHAFRWFDACEDSVGMVLTGTEQTVILGRRKVETPGSELRRKLVPLASHPGTAEARDAALALSAVGDESWVQACIANAGVQRSQVHSIVASLARSLTRARDLDLAHALDLSFELAHASIANPVRVRELVDTLNINLAHARALDLDRAQALDLSPEHTIDLVRTLDLTLDFANDFTYKGNLAREIERSIEATRIRWVDSAELMQTLDSALISIRTIRRVTDMLTQMARVWATLIAACAQRWPSEAEPLIDLSRSDLITSEELTNLVHELSSSNDLQREHARKVLSTEHNASALGPALIEQMADLAHTYTTQPQITSVLDRALKTILHDTPTLVVEWIDRTDKLPSATIQTILSTMHNVTPKSFETILNALPHTLPHVKASLLESLSWLVRLRRIPREDQKLTLEQLLAWLDQEMEPGIHRAVIEILGYWPEDSDTIVSTLLNWLDRAGPETRPALYIALARFAASQSTIPESVEDVLREACPDPCAAAAITRLNLVKVSREEENLTSLEKERVSATLLKELAPILPDPSHCFMALLDAGTDDGYWDNQYHGIVATAARLHLERNPGLLKALLKRLQEALEEQGWSSRRIVLATAAACAEVMPLALQDASRSNLEALLVKGAKDAESHDSRRFALTALSYLRVVTPAVVPVLLANSQDIETVQFDAIAAAARFQVLQEDLLPALVVALTGESASTAYIVVQLLGAVGTSIAGETVNLQRQIIETLVVALRDPGSEREVFFLNKSYGKLEEALYAALLQVSGLPG